MAEIKIFALGGLGESGKYMYVVSVDDNIMILDAGISIPSQDLLGIDQVIPDLTFVEENKDKVKGIFLSSSNSDKIGAIPELLKIADFDIYCSRFTSFIVEDKLKDANLEDKYALVHMLRSGEEVRIDDNTYVNLIQMSYSIPETTGIAIHTADGVVFYSGAYNFKPRFDVLYKTDYSRLIDLKKENVICLMSESIGCTYRSNTEADYLLSHRLDEAFKLDERLIVSTYSKDFSKIQLVVDLCVKYNRKLGIIGRKAQRALDIGINQGYLTIPDEILMPLKFIDENNDNYSKDMVVLVTGDKHEPYYMLQRIARRRDKLIHMHKNDVVVILTVPYAGIEKMAATSIDVLYRCGAKVIQMERKILRSDHASCENTMQLYSFLEPRYVMPVMGEYRHLFAQRKVALDSNFLESNIIMAGNGEVHTFIDGVHQDNVYEVTTGDILIDGALVGDVNEVVLKDREYLSEDGLVLVIANVDARKRKILNDVEIVSYGFISEKEAGPVYEEMKRIFIETVNKHFLNRYIDWQELKNQIRDEINSYLYKEIKRRTLVIPTIIDTQTE